MKSVILSLAVLTLTLPALAEIPAAPESGKSVIRDGKTYVQRDGTWFLVENAIEFRVLDEVTLRFAPGVPAAEQATLLAEEGLEVIRRNRLGWVDARIPAGSPAFEVAHRLLEKPAFEKVLPATRGEFISNDPYFNQQWALENLGTGGAVYDADIDAVEAWTVTTGDPSIIVASLDSGLDYRHNDLGPNVWQNLGEDADGDGATLYQVGGQWIMDLGDMNGVDDDGNGFIDDFVGWDTENNSREIMDTYGHGTHVCGIIGARTNNNLSVAGVAGGYGQDAGVRIMQVQVGEFSPSSSALDDAILYAVDNGARIITMSLSVNQSASIDQALDYAHAQGVFVDCAAGNGGSSTVYYPANHPTVAAVSSTNDRDQLSGFSSYGNEIDLSAPGEDIMSTYISQSQTSMSGTSMAAPHVAAVAGLVLSLAPWMTGDQVLQVLRDTAEDRGAAGWDHKFGWGRINAFDAVSAVAGLGTLKANAFSIDPTAAVKVDFTLEAGAAYANRNYLLLASLSGTSPGTPLVGEVLPLNWDLLTNLSIAFANTWFFTNTLSALDGAGAGQATFQAGAGDLRPASGLTLSFAYLLDPPFDMVSNAVNIHIK